MEVITQFRRLLLAQVLLGILAFCMASENPGLMVVAGGLIALSWYIVEGPAGRPLPHWVVVCGGGAAAACLILDMPSTRSGFLVGVGYFTMALQILLLFSRKSNREYGEVLILSLMQLVGASVLNVSIVYGLMLAVYCGLGIFTLVAFQFKITSDAVRERTRRMMPANAGEPASRAAVGRGYRWQFRVTAGGLGLGCCVIAAVVFVLAPRDDAQRAAAAPIFSAFQPREAGFTTHVDLKTPPDTTHDSEWVMHFTLTRNGRRVEGEQSFHLRGTALDHYDNNLATWNRWRPASGENPRGNVSEGIDLVRAPAGAGVIEGHVVLRGTVDNTLFALSPVIWVRSDQIDAVTYSPYDQRLACRGTPTAPIEYDFRSLDTNAGAPTLAGALSGLAHRPHWRGAIDDSLRRGEVDYLRTWYSDSDEVRQLALAIVREAGLDRDPQTIIDPHDFEIARALASYLRTHYTYSLTRDPVRDGVDPIYDFLFNDKRGHCELFAAALTAMARSIGMTSRMVTGYLVSEYSQVGGYYVVRQADAHAWAEVYCGVDGWREIDPTPGGSTGRHAAQRSSLAVFREIYDRIDFAWITAVVAYDGKTRANILKGLSQWSGDLLEWGVQKCVWVSAAAEGLAHSSGFLRLDMGALMLAGVAVLMMGWSTVRMTLARRRSLEALHIRHVPRAQRQVLARRLGFYLQTVELLERHGLVRPVWQTPRAYAESVVRSHQGRLAALMELTDIFYEVRFGRRDIDPTIEARVRASYQALNDGLRGRS